MTASPPALPSTPDAAFCSSPRQVSPCGADGETTDPGASDAANLLQSLLGEIAQSLGRRETH